MYSSTLSEVSIIKNRGSAKHWGKIATGFSVDIFKVCPSATIEVGLKKPSALLLFLKVLSREDFTASAVKGLPLENLTPSLILNSQVNLSSLTFHSSASDGSNSPFSLKRTKFSPTP